VPPGDYTFRVIAANSDGVWNTEWQSLRVVVLPPFYRTWWFRALAGLGVAATIGLAWRYRTAQFKRAQALREQFSRQLIESQEHERKRIAAEQQHRQTRGGDPGERDHPPRRAGNRNHRAGQRPRVRPRSRGARPNAKRHGSGTGRHRGAGAHPGRPAHNRIRARQRHDHFFENQNTVQTHRKNICVKLQLEGNHALMRFALEHKSQL
jgi:hypothetical protein